jgi:hypothetical protein
MKKIMLSALIINVALLSYSQNVGIGTTSPIARLHVSDSNVVFTTNFAPPVSGAGSRMMWYPQKAAFRVGGVDGNQWDKDSIGLFSFATGFNTKTLGFASTSMGEQTSAIGINSTSMGFSTNANGYASTSMGYFTNANGFASNSMGYFTNAIGINSTSMGEQTSAIGFNSTSMGYLTNANGYESTSMGYRTNANGYRSTSMGDQTNANGYASTSMGYFTNANGNYSTSMGVATVANGISSLALGNGTITRGTNSTSMGNATIARSLNSLVAGTFNDTTNTNRLFEIGNGTANTARSNAMTVLTNGNVGIGASTPNAALQFANIAASRKIVLYEAANNDHQFSGFGLEPAFIRYQLASPAGYHIFFAGTSPTNSNELFRISGNGNATLAGVLTQNSDVRLKTNIRPIRSALEQLQNINGYTYYWLDKNRDNSQQVGVLAQEVQQIYPQLVHQNEKGELSVNYMGLVPVLIEAIKEQNKKLEDLQKQMEEQRKMIEQLLKK